MNPVCAVCGDGGYWVGYSAQAEGFRCINHLPDDPQDPEIRFVLPGWSEGKSWSEA